MRRNYKEKLSHEIISKNYDLVYYVAQKCGNYRDTSVSKNEYLFRGSFYTFPSLILYIFFNSAKSNQQSSIIELKSP